MCRDTTYPREGTETEMNGLLIAQYETQLIPARGRKPSPTLAAAADAPQTQLIPARGRKLVTTSVGFFQPLDTTYPREGTETP